MRDRERQLQQLRRRLDTCDLGRRLAAIRTRLVTADGRVTGAMARRWQRADARLRECAGRLDTLSPLAVLGRGYAVCWNADRTRIVRDAATTPRETGFGSRSPAASCTARCARPIRSLRSRNRDNGGYTGTLATGRDAARERQAMADTSIKDFEGAIAELDGIVKKLEEGDLPLEQSLALVRARRAAVALLSCAPRGCRTAHRDSDRARRAQAGARVADAGRGRPRIVPPRDAGPLSRPSCRGPVTSSHSLAAVLPDRHQGAANPPATRPRCAERY